MKDKIARSDAQSAIALAKKAGSGGGTLIPIPTSSDIGKVIIVENAGEFGFVKLPEPMVFKGTLGTGGTIESLPTASDSNKGFVYIVITDGTYAGQSAKAGDMFISNATEWVLVPSGDDSGSLVISQTLTAGSTSITFNHASITATSFIAVASEEWYTASTQTTGSVTLTFPEQSTDMLVQIMVAN